MNSIISSGIDFLYNFGFFTIILPFILIYVIMYGFLQKVQIFGKGNSNYNAIFSFCVSFFTIYNLDIAEGLPIFISRIALFIVIIIILQIFAHFIGFGNIYENKKMQPVIIIIIGFYLLYTVIEAFFDFKKIVEFTTQYISLQTIGGIGVFVVVFIAIIWFITSGDNSTSSNTQSTSKSELKPSKKEEKKKEGKKETKTKEEKNEEKEEPRRERSPFELKDPDAPVNVREGKTYKIDDLLKNN